MKRLHALLLAAWTAGAVAGCDGHGSAPVAPAVRPVLSVVVEPAAPQQADFAGVIEPRYQTERAFQVLGRIVARPVDVGDTVVKGQAIAEIDPLTYQLAVRADEADLASAKAELEKTAARRGRVQSLVARGVSPQSELDSAEEAAASAAAAVQVAAAQLAKAKEDLGYTKLTADMDGIVTRVSAEVGQMAAPGKTVMTLARTDIREAVVDVPEDVARALAPGAAFEIRLQSDRAVATAGSVREIAPQADAATRLRRVKITLDRPAAPFRIGATVTATPAAAAAGPSLLELPATAIFERDGATRVWIVDGASKRVRSAVVDVAAGNGGTVRIARGLAAGDRVVIAGVNSLAEGQAVQIDAGAAA